MTLPTVSVQPATMDENWSVDDEPALDKPLKQTKQILSQQDSTSSLSSSPSKTGGSLSKMGLMKISKMTPLNSNDYNERNFVKNQ